MWTSCLSHSTACSDAAVAYGRDCNRPADSPPPPLTAAAAEVKFVGHSATADVERHSLVHVIVLWSYRLVIYKL